MTILTLTDEQQAILDTFQQRKDKEIISVQGGAGVGKTHTKRAIAQHSSGHGVYLVFGASNKAAAKESFSDKCQVYTLNGFAYKHKNIYKSARRIADFSYRDIYHVVKELSKSIPSGAHHVKATVINFCQSGDVKVTAAHLAQSTLTLNKDIQGQVIEGARLLFNRARSSEHIKAPLPHYLYLKEWVLDGCEGINEYDYVLFDEIQDSNDVSLSVLDHVNSALVMGDPYQSIYGFRGAHNTFAKINATKHLFLQQSFRFGDSIAALANAITEDRYKTGFKLSGNPTIHSQVARLEKGSPHTRIYRTLLELTLDLLYLADRGLKVEVLGLQSDLINKLETARALYNGERYYNPHPALAHFKSWDDFEFAAENTPFSDLNASYRLVAQYGERIETILTLLKQSGTAKGAPIKLTTAHRAKGLEFDHIVVCSDFDNSLGLKHSKVSGDELNMLYVAATRARLTVDPMSHELDGIAKSIGLTGR